MPPTVTLISPASLPTATLVAASRNSHAGKANDRRVEKKPYERSTEKGKRKAGTEEQGNLSIAVESILTRAPPPFPVTSSERSMYLRPAKGEGKPAGKVTAFQWRLYDMLCKVPAGKVSTYGQLASLLSSSPRAVGSALRNNPFAPTVPCHRIIASTLFIGGFGGEWTGEPKNKKSTSAFSAGPLVTEKLELLRREGVGFDVKGYLKSKEYLWDGKEVNQPTNAK
ncbi:hypothetical protein JCM11251_007410 [Rhodosporidiobolus azoricus]